MISFQRELAERLLKSYSYDFSSLVVMFPSLRARTFFNDAVSSITNSPIWQPSWTTVDELMQGGSGLVRGERIRLIAELFKVYHKYHQHETFDHFYFWGDMLISDFDMIDKYMVDAKMLLTNIKDIKEIEADVSYLSVDQERIIRFWSSVYSNESISAQKRRFLEIWESLPAIYEEYRERLKAIGIGYPGLLYRTTAERIQRGEAIELPNKRFIIAGFNALSESEKILFDYIAKSEKGAEFYWDYDSYYVDNKDHEAGLFMRDNIKQFSNIESVSHGNFTTAPKQLCAIGCVSNIAQVKYIKSILEDIPADELNKDTAIVLTDESLLTPLLHSLPESIGKVNITMGYPLKNSPVYSLIERIIALQAHSRAKDDTTLFYHKDVTGLLSHPYITDCCARDAAKFTEQIVTERMTSVNYRLFADHNVLSKIFLPSSNWKELCQQLIDAINTIMQRSTLGDAMQLEFLRIAAEELTKCRISIENCGLEMPIAVFCSLIRRHLQTLTIPFEGEPLEGVQVMGILETRNIDFKNVIILSMTDANFPGNRTEQPSFIPYSLRVAYNIPTPEHHEAMYAYYFYRLIQRAEKVNMLYCSRADDKSTGECSRYIHQLDFESPHKVEKQAIGVDLCIDTVEEIVIPKGEFEISRLNYYTDPDESGSLSPTRLFHYVECPMKFYFHTIAHLRTSDELGDKIDAPTFGNILHKTMEDLYKEHKILKNANPKPLIAKICKREIVEPAVNKTIGKMIHNNPDASPDIFSGDTLLVRDIIVKYILSGVMKYDLSREGFVVMDVENEIKDQYKISSGKEVRISGIADRIDRLPDGTIQVIDYKSGNTPHLEFDGLNSLFNGNSKQRISNIFQTLLYAMIMRRKQKADAVPSLYYASKMLGKEYSPLIYNKVTKSKIERYSSVADEFEELLTVTLDELFDPNIPFRQTSDEEMCKKCNFKGICRRRNEQQS